MSRALERLGLPVRHILADGRLESQAEAMQRLLSVVGLPETDLFRSQEELIAAACVLQEERIAYMDEGMQQPVSTSSSGRPYLALPSGSKR